MPQNVFSVRPRQLNAGRTGTAPARRSLTAAPGHTHHLPGWRGNENDALSLYDLIADGARRIAYHLHMARSTVERVLARYRMPKLSHIDQATGLPVRKPKPKRYEVKSPGKLVHVDIKKQGRIPNGGGWRAHGRGSPQDRAASVARGKKARSGPSSARGYRYLHHGVDDYSRVAYCEILDDERKESAAAFWGRAQAFFESIGIKVSAVMTDNGACYRSKMFAQALGENIKHKRTKPYRPQTNGKVERFNRTLAQEWAYAQAYSSEEERAQAYQAWLHEYNHHRPHTGIGGQTPASRVHNFTGKYS